MYGAAALNFHYNAAANVSHSEKERGGVERENFSSRRLAIG